MPEARRMLPSDHFFACNIKDRRLITLSMDQLGLKHTRKNFSLLTAKKFTNDNLTNCEHIGGGMNYT